MERYLDFYYNSRIQCEYTQVCSKSHSTQIFPWTYPGQISFFCLEKLCHRSLQILFTKSNRIKRFMFSRKGKLVNKRNTLHKKVSVFGVILVRIQPKCGKTRHVVRGGSRAAATSKMKRFVIIANGLALHLGCCSSPRSASGSE